MNNVALPDRYEIISELGSGGMGKVYLAHDTILKKSVAIKVLNTDSLENDPSKLQRFQREAKAAGRMRHESLVTVMDFGLTPSGQPYLVMDYAEGPTLKEVIESEGPFSADAALDILAKLASAIAHAHSNGVVHRDLKTSNIVLTDAGKESRQPVVVDFGIALMIEDDAERSLQSNLTRTNAIIGSPHYMSPEQVQGKRADERSDIYSLGCIFFECLTGHPPFQGETLMATMEMHLKEPIPLIEPDEADGAISQDLNAVLGRALAKEPSERFSNTAEMGAALANIGLEVFEQQPSAAGAEKERGIELSYFIVVGFMILIGVFSFYIWPKSEQQESMPSLESRSIKVKRYEGVSKELVPLIVKQKIEDRQNLSKTILANRLSDQNSKQSRKLDLSGFVLSDAKLSLVAANHTLVNLILSDVEFDNPSDLGKLKGLNLKYLTVRGSNFDDRGAIALADFKNLQSLEATACDGLSVRGIVKLSKIPTLVSLEIGGARIDDNCLKAVSGMKDLRMLSVYNSPNISNQGINYLSQMKLTKLILRYDGQLTLECLKSISKIKNLKKLDLIGAGFINATQGDVDILKDLNNLTELHLLEQQITPEAVAHLRKFLPQCKIFIGEIE